MVNSMSFQSYREFMGANKLNANAEQTQMVKRVGGNIRRAVERYCAENGMSDKLDGYQWEFNLIEDASVNAWAMPGGKAVVYTGMLPVAQSEAGLAVVMGHEIAHNIARHGNERMSQALLLDMGGTALSQALAESPAKTKELFSRSYEIGTHYGVLLPYSRIQETEADRLGLIFMAMAGYKPDEAVGFWQRMAAQKKGTSPPEFLSTHPADATRIENIRSFLPEARGYYR
jgi:predicted Zn-dependent protease